MKLAIVSDTAVFHQGGEYFSGDTFLQFVAHLGNHFDGITFLTPVFERPPKTPLFQIPLGDGGRIEIAATCPYENVVEFYLHAPQILLRNAPVFARAIRGADAVLMRLPAMNSLLAAVCARIYRKPLFSYVVGNEQECVETGGKYRGFWKHAALAAASFHARLYRVMVRRSNASFFLSTQMKTTLGNGRANEMLMFTSLVDSAGIGVHGNGVMHHGALRLLYVGRLSREKGVAYLLEAVALLRRGGVATLAICGDGPERGALETLACEIGIESCVKFHGFVPWGRQLEEFYEASDVFVLPSLSEGVPKVLLEAMSRGVPIVATEVGGVGDILRNLENGILVAPGAAAPIAEAVRRLEHDERLRARLVRAGLDFAREHTAARQAMKLARWIQQYATAEAP
jgi:hypothetical protein